MARTEYECRILNIDLEEFLSKLESLDAEDKGERLQRRFVYDFDPVDPDKWIRLRTNGNVTTLAIKSLKRTDAIGNTDEEEVVVGDFDTTNRILEQLGYKHRNYQENKRHSFKFGQVSIDIDSWPRIPTYVEVEGSSEEEVLYTLKILGVDLSQVTTKDVESIYREIYGIDLLSIKELKFSEDMLEPHKSL
ncbi:MAG: CYTH domain-containing protein [Bacilli bacterium]|nr:CYTH domain-containing protein [Bacilli bacterium]MDE6141087.1 CYTH domain-containing protein [Bacilli bacterium]